MAGSAKAEAQRLWVYEDVLTLVQRAHWIDDFMCSQWSKLHPDIYKPLLRRGRTELWFFKAPGWVTRGFLHWKYAENSKSHIQPVWSNFNDSICVGGQDYSPLALKALNLLLYLGWVSGLKTSTSNHKIQTNIGIKQDHTVIRIVMNLFFVKHLYPSEQDVTPQ